MADKAVSVTRARQLTPEEVQERVDHAFDLETRIKSSYVHVHEAWWDLSEHLFLFSEGGCWVLLGYDRLEDWLAQPDLGMSRSQFFLMVKLWRDLVVTRQIEPASLHEIEPSKVREVAPAIMKGEVEIEDALDDARELGYRDVREKYHPGNRAKHGQDPDDAKSKLAAEDEPERTQCPACGSWVTEEELASHEQ